MYSHPVECLELIHFRQHPVMTLMLSRHRCMQYGELPALASSLVMPVTRLVYNQDA